MEDTLHVPRTPTIPRTPRNGTSGWDGRQLGGGLALVVATAGSTGRDELEAFVADAFKREHHASVRSFMPMLIGCRDARGKLGSVVGLRAGGVEPLFLEHYLDRPAHELLTAATGRDVRRECIVEVGNLAGSNCRAAVRLISALPQMLLAQGFEWIVFTGTRVVRDLLAAFDAPLLELAAAGEACVAGGLDEWGRYYTTDPRVCAGYLPHARSIAAFAGPSGCQ
jgi:Thermostable hemolysin